METVYIVSGFNNIIGTTTILAVFNNSNSANEYIKQITDRDNDLEWSCLTSTAWRVKT